MEGDLLVGAAGARRLRRFRYLTALVNVLGLIQQLILGQDKNISWIQSIEIAEDSTKDLHLFYKFSISVFLPTASSTICSAWSFLAQKEQII
ncbi:hypothetical protein TRIUR3_29358 [Triticum urartu]|uniref:Uncharacterized protein n=1 Tax=Triticum urartu TaxID=4572 RepID=M7ZYP9_TRIUA|nr:hypothetical protein TRIUR3_29358 [Triticum urartu]